MFWIGLDDSLNSDDVIMAGSLTDEYEKGSSLMMSPEDCLGLDLGILLASHHIVTTYRSTATSFKLFYNLTIFRISTFMSLKQHSH